MRTLLIDIETSPNLAWTFELRNAFISIDQIDQPSRMICFAAKWLGEPRVEFKSEHHHSREEMVEKAHSLLDEADVLMHFNGQKFDEPRINVEFYRLGLKPPSPYQRIDLWKTVSKQFDFPSSKLAWVLRESELPGKVETGGFSLWKGCMAGDENSWKLMKRYNIQDVNAMEPLYERLRPWILNHPSHAAESGEMVCTRCGAADLQKRGFARTLQSTYQRYQCMQCGGWMRGTKREFGTEIREVA